MSVVRSSNKMMSPEAPQDVGIELTAKRLAIIEEAARRTIEKIDAQLSLTEQSTQREGEQQIAVPQPEVVDASAGVQPAEPRRPLTKMERLEAEARTAIEQAYRQGASYEPAE